MGSRRRRPLAAPWARDAPLACARAPVAHDPGVRAQLRARIPAHRHPRIHQRRALPPRRADDRGLLGPGVRRRGARRAGAGGPGRLRVLGDDVAGRGRAADPAPEGGAAARADVRRLRTGAWIRRRAGPACGRRGDPGHDTAIRRAPGIARHGALAGSRRRRPAGAHVHRHAESPGDPGRGGRARAPRPPRPLRHAHRHVRAGLHRRAGGTREVGGTAARHGREHDRAHGLEAVAAPGPPGHPRVHALGARGGW